MVIEQGDLRDSSCSSAQAPVERRASEAQGPCAGGSAESPAPRPYQLEDPSRHNAEHTYNLTRRLYELFLDEDRQYTMAYYRDLSNSLEKAQLDKKAHIASKLYLKPGMKVLDVGCGWGGFALYLHRMYGVEVLGVALAPDQVDFSNERAREAGGVSGKVKFRAPRLSRSAGPFDRIRTSG